MKRLLDANPSDFEKVAPRDLVASIRLSEGRVVVAEVAAPAPPMIDKVSNVELAAAFGADIVVLNLYDVTRPRVMGLPAVSEESEEVQPFGAFQTGEGRTLADVKAWIGRSVGLNLEPIENPEAVPAQGRLATPANAHSAVDQGADFIVVTGNPATGVTSTSIARSLKAIRREIGEQAMILAGKAHAAGSYEPVVTENDLKMYLEAGADGVVLPAPGTIPAMTVEAGRALVEFVHRLEGIVLSAISTSQEGASRSTIEQIALMSKMTGADMHHIGDAGTNGIAIPENIYTLSLALRGRRHTWHRMAASLRR